MSYGPSWPWLLALSAITGRTECGPVSGGEVKRKGCAVVRTRGGLISRRRLRQVLAAGAVISLTALGTGVAAASAHSGPVHGGRIHLYFEDTLAQSVANEPSQVVVSGAFGDAGSFSIGSNDVAKIVLSKGTLEVNDRAGAAREATLFGHLARYMNPRTCAVVFRYTVTEPIVKGSGTRAYKGITGRLTTTTDDVGVWPAKGGRCETSSSSIPVGFVALSQGAGSVSFG
jgi:hypothetical protein